MHPEYTGLAAMSHKDRADHNGSITMGHQIGSGVVETLSRSVQAYMENPSSKQTDLRAAIYCRISQTDQRIDKVEIQQRDCERYATRQGYAVVAVYVDDGLSAYSGRPRPDYLQMLRDIEMRRFDVIVATFEDRLSRRPEEKLMLAATCREAGVIWNTINDGLIDPGDPDDKFVAYVRGWIGEKEQVQKVRRLRARFDDRRAQGLPLWGARPFGFEVDRVTHREDEAAEVRWAYEHVKQGGSVYGVVKRWNSLGVQTSRGGLWSSQSVKQVLRRPSNAGLMQVQSKVLWDAEVAWEPIIDRQTWEEVRTTISDPARSTVESREPRWLCAGIALCGVCGDVLRSGTGSDRKSSFRIYRCARKGRSATTDGRRHTAVKVADLDPLVRSAVVSAFLLGPTSILPDGAPDLADVRSIERLLRKVRQDQDDNTSLVGTRGVTVRIIKERAEALYVEEQRLEAELDEHRRRSAQAAMLVGSAATLFKRGKRVSFAAAAQRMTELGERFDALPLEQKRTLVRGLLTVTVNPGRALDRIQIGELWRP